MRCCGNEGVGWSCIYLETLGSSLTGEKKKEREVRFVRAVGFMKHTEHVGYDEHD